MRFRLLFKYSIVLLFTSLFFVSNAQKVTKITGKVFDKETKEPLVFVDVSFLGTAIGVSTDLDGFFSLESRFASDTMVINYIGYNTLKVPVRKDKRVRDKFYLESSSLKIETVKIKAKKKKYSVKNNPAVELIKKVLANKDKNRISELPYHSYDQYEKVRLDLNNITDKFKNGPFIKDFDFLWEFIDTSALNGRTYLPVFMREILSTKYHKKEGNSKKEIRRALNYTRINDKVDENSLNSVIDLLYTDIDIYAQSIDLLENNFVSPLSSFGIGFYRYYINDTTEVDGQSLINVSFIPEDKGDFGFYGTMDITNDDRYAVVDVDLNILKGINLNFVRDIKIEQSFSLEEGYLIPTKDDVVIDYSFTDNGIGFYGSKSTHFDNFSFEAPDDLSVFSNIEDVVELDDYSEKDELFWENERMVPLNSNDENLYAMMDTLRKNRRYQAYVIALGIASTGYIPFKYFELGKVSNAANFNQVEGWNYRMGIGTKEELFKKIRLQGNVSYASKPKNWKWYAEGLYSFNSRWRKSSKNEIKFIAEEESFFPGQELDFFSPENILLSIRRGETTRMLLTERYALSYLKEGKGFDYEIGGILRDRQGIGSLDFRYYDEDLGSEQYLENIRTTEAYVKMRYARNEQFLQGKDVRVQLQNEFPIFTLRYGKGFNNLLKGDYNYHNLKLSLFKQYEWTLVGTTNITIQAGKIWGNVPYVLDFIPTGNQTYAYQIRAYNLMNFMEFAADQFVDLHIEHYFYGYFLNAIPLIRKLKLRENFDFKILYGALKDSNNPELNPELVQFARDSKGNARTFTFGKLPYAEVSLGFSNIFRIFRVDFVQRLTYLDHPDVPVLFKQKGLALRFRTQVEF